MHKISRAGPGLFDEETTRSLLDQLLTDSRLYRRSKDYKDLLEFVVRLKDFAPFNAMLLQVQKPGLKYAASARDWLERFGRWPKEGVRSLLIPVAFRTRCARLRRSRHRRERPAGRRLQFSATGSVNPARLRAFEKPLSRKNVALSRLDAGDTQAGYVRVLKRGTLKARW